MKYYPPKKTKSLLPKNIPKYYGLLSINSQDYFLKKAISSYKCQIQRCYYKSKKDYKYYGAKGIEVSYSKRDFVSWYLFNIKNFKGKKPTVGRIDHSKNYSFDNIEMQELTDNINEMINRRKLECISGKRRNFNNNGLEIKILDYASGNIINTSKSISDAEKLTGVSRNSIIKYCTGEYEKTKGGITFRFLTNPKKKIIKNFERKNKYLIIIFCEKSKEPIFIAKNYKEVFNLTGIRESHINRYCNGEIKRSTKGYTLRYWSGNESELPSL